MRRRQQRDQESRCRFLDSLRSLGMTGRALHGVIPSGARSAESRNLHFSTPPRENHSSGVASPRPFLPKLSVSSAPPCEPWLVAHLLIGVFQGAKPALAVWDSARAVPFASR